MSNLNKLDKIYNKLLNVLSDDNAVADHWTKASLTEAIDMVDELINKEIEGIDLYKGASDDAEDYLDGVGRCR